MKENTTSMHAKGTQSLGKTNTASDKVAGEKTTASHKAGKRAAPKDSKAV